MNIFLIGYRCTGKSSAGRMLSERVGWQFVDSDAEVERECGMAISEMVSDHGWRFFRERERSVMRRLCRLDCQVIATGGGVILDHENVEGMKCSGTVIWLRAGPETIKKRMSSDEATARLRPALTSEDVLEEIKDTLIIRTPLYEDAMDFHMHTDHLTMDDVCTSIIERLELTGVNR